MILRATSLMFKIENHDNVHIHIIPDDRSEARELLEYFQFYAEGYRFHPAYKSKRWDGKISLWNPNTGLILRGLLYRVIEFCKERGYRVEVEPSLLESYPISLDETQTFIDSLNFTSKGNPIVLRDYQVDAVQRGLSKRRMLCISPTSSGKSAIISGIARYLQTIFEPQEKVLIVVPNINLVNQFAYDLCDYFSTDIDWLKTDPIHTIFAGQEKNVSSQIIVSTWQSLHKMPKEYFEQFRGLVVDECFDGNTKVLTPTGYKCISEIHAGDVVLNYSETTGEFKEDVVVEVHKNHTSSLSEKMYELSTDDGSIIKVTGNHQFLTSNRGWVRVDELSVNDDIISYDRSEGDLDN